MKSRHGFVSNSSSTSFIVVTDGHIKLARDNKIKLYKVSYLILMYKPLVDAINSIDREVEANRFPGFIFIPDMSYDYNNLCDLEHKHPGCYITEPIDREQANENNFDGTYESGL